jgi:two-component system NtrC family sensor kinase
MKLLIKIFFLLFLPVFVVAQVQHNQLDSMHQVVRHAANDTIRMDAYTKLGFYYDDVNLDSAVYYGEQGIAIARQLGLKLNEAEILMNTSFPLSKMGNYPGALKLLTQALTIAENPFNEKNPWHLAKGQTPATYGASLLGYVHMGFDNLYGCAGSFEKQLQSAYTAEKIAESTKDSVLLAEVYPDIGDAYIKLNKLDSALYFEKKALRYFAVIPFESRKYEGQVYSSIGSIYQQMGNIDLARENFETAIQTSSLQNNQARAGDACLQMATLYYLLEKPDSGLLYAKKALAFFNLVGKEKAKASAYRMISDFYEYQKKSDSSFVYLRLSTLLNDSLDQSEKKKLQEFQVAGFNEQLRLHELEKEKIQTQSNIRSYVMLAGIVIFMLIALLLYRNNRNRKRANVLLQKQKEEVQSTLSELKSTQQQLIQSEKMASLGELTAGIAHEIQNPLNFVNNFAEVSNELIDEMKDELSKGNYEDVNAIADDVKQNLEKINHHGKRADAIVKGMLQHSRTSAGKKEPTDINALADEYLRLSYHGLRAKEKEFNATMKTNFDESIGKINIIPQDIGRVLLNLYNNAFYAVTEKKKEANDGYEPTVSVNTKKSNGKIEISVTDNGNGIPQKVIDKIFQPFFTTKPTGEGTGLGLSLSYDIVKTHDGSIKAESSEGVGTTFIIQIPNS